MAKNPVSSTDRTTIPSKIAQHADSIATEMRRRAVSFIARQALPYIKRRAALLSSDPIPDPPKWLFHVSAGVGKTRAMAAAAIEAVELGLRVVIAVPTVRLGYDIQHEIERHLPGASGIWLGREQQDPNDPKQKMCPRHDAANAAHMLGLRPSSACGHRKTGFCKHRPAVGRAAPCAYRQQDLSHAQVVIIAGGSMLELAPNKKIQRAKKWRRYNVGQINQQYEFESIPKAPPKKVPANIKSEDHFDLLLVDETNPFFVLKGFDEERPFLPEKNAYLSFSEQNDIQTILSGFLLEITAMISTQEELHLRPYTCETTSNLSPEVMSLEILECVHEVASEALHLAQSKAAAQKSISRDSGKKIIERAGDLVAIRAALLTICWICEAMILAYTKQLDQIAHIEIERREAGSGLYVRRKTKINYHYSKIPTMLFDATGEAQLLEHIFGTISESYHRTAVDGAGVRRFQLRDETVTYSQLDNPSWGRRIRLFAELLEIIHGTVGLVVPMKVELQIKASLSSSIKVLHFGAERGDNSLETVTALVVASRLAKHPSYLEDMVAVLTEAPVQRLPEERRWFPKQEGFIVHRDQNAGWPVSRDFHPDPLVECARRSITEAGLEQALARGRNVRRNESKPLHEYILTNAATSRLVDGTFTKAQFVAVAGWVGELLLAGVWVVDGKGQGILQPILHRLSSQRRECLLEYTIGDPAFESPEKVAKWRKDQLADNPEIARLVNQIDRSLRNGAESVDLLFSPFPLTAFQPIRAKVRGARYYAQLFVRVEDGQTPRESLLTVLGPFAGEVEIEG